MFPDLTSSSKEKSVKSKIEVISQSILAGLLLILIGFFLYLLWFPHEIVIEKDGQRWSCPKDAPPETIEKFLEKASQK